MGEKKNVIIIAAVACFVLVVAGVAGYFFLFSSSATTKREVNKQLKMAAKYLIEENYEDAVVSYKIALKNDPENATASEGLINTYLKWADSLVEKGNTSRAIMILEQAIGDTEYTKGDQRLADKLKELKDSMVEEEPEEEVVEEEEVDEGPEFLKTTINESDFDMELFGKNIREWNPTSICEFAENDSSMHLDRTEGKEKYYRDETNKLEVILSDDEDVVIIQDRDYFVSISPSSYGNYSYSCMVYYSENEHPELGQVIAPPKIAEGTVYDYLSGYSEDLTKYVLNMAIYTDEDYVEITNATLKVSEWAKDDTSAELRGLKIDFGTWDVDIHHQNHKDKMDYIRFGF